MMSTLGADRWMRVGLRQLSGMLVMVFALSSLSVRSCSNALFASFSYMQQRLHHACLLWYKQCAWCCKTYLMFLQQRLHHACCCSASNMHGAVHGPSPDVTLHRHRVTCTVAKRPLLLSHGVNAADSIPNFMQPSSASCAPALLHRYKCSCFLIPHEPCLFHCFI